MKFVSTFDVFDPFYMTNQYTTSVPRKLEIKSDVEIAFKIINLILGVDEESTAKGHLNIQNFCQTNEFSIRLID